MAQNEQIDERIRDLVNQLEPITLEEMSGIKLMNRTDTKFVTNKRKLAQLLEMARGEYYAQFTNDSMVAEYITTYWDTDQLAFYFQHHNGRAPRQKVRVRTYVGSDLTFLEVKTKNNHGRTKKKRIEVPSQEVAEVQAEADEFLAQRVHRTLADIHPTVQNHFHRITLVNKGKTERLTIDFDVEFRNFETRDEAQTGELVIIELKRDGNVPSPVLDILRQLRIKPSGFSKYCIGSVMTNRGLKHNMFMEKMVRIKKLVNAK
ncbi:MAG: polyphosphate polymerase domain-containing protein [Bacteroidaceae bacterium]|nr:polyphosphate polymerase domain-containing protein [Bacteroidaceae bacterium]